MPGCAVVRVGAGNNPAGRGTEGPVKRESRTHCARDQSGQLRWVIDIAGRPVEGHLIAGGKRTRRGIWDQAIHGIDNCQFRMRMAMAAAMPDRAIIARCRRLLPFRRMILGNREIHVSVSRLATRHQQDGDHPNDPNVLHAELHLRPESDRGSSLSIRNPGDLRLRRGIFWRTTRTPLLVVAQRNSQSPIWTSRKIIFNIDVEIFTESAGRAILRRQRNLRTEIGTANQSQIGHVFLSGFKN